MRLDVDWLDNGRSCVPALVFARTADATTTFYGLTIPGVVELNPFVAAAMASFGRPTSLFVLTVLTLGLVIASTETMIHYFGSRVDTARLRYIGYGPHIIIALFAVLNNLVVIAHA